MSKTKRDASFSVDQGRPYRLAHQTLCITGINFETESLVGYVELLIYPQTPDLKRVKINSKQCKIFRVAINETIEATFTYNDPTLEICQGKTKHMACKCMASPGQIGYHGVVRIGGNMLRNLTYFETYHCNAISAVDPDAKNGELTVKLPPDVLSIVQEMRSFRICIEFSLDHPLGGVKFVVPDMDGTMLDRGAHLFTYGHENSSRLWFPCIDSYSEVCTWKLEFTVNMYMTAVSCGDLIETVYTADLRKKTYHYYLSTPTAAANIALVVGPFEVLVDPHMHEVTHFCLPNLMPILKHTTSSLHEVFEFYEELLSVRYPYSCYKQVFVDMPYKDAIPYATMTICSTNLLHSKKIIDQTPISRQLLAHAVAHQFFGCFISLNSWNDAWLVKGLASYLCSLLQKNAFGLNEHQYHVAQDMREVCDYETNVGPVILDPSQSTSASPLVKHPQTISPKYADIYDKKSRLIIRMLEIRIGHKLILQVLNKLLSLAANAAQQKFASSMWSNMLISTAWFQRCISTVTGKDIQAFLDQWVYQGGVSRFSGQFVFNRKRNLIDLELKHHWTAKGATKYAGPLSMSLQEFDGSFTHQFMIEENKTRYDIPCHSKSRRLKKKKIPLCTGEEVDMDLVDTDADSPVLWLRIDPEMTILRSLKMEQPDFMWQYMLRYERCVVSQGEAIAALEFYPTAKTRLALTDTIENDKCFYRIRIDAAACLAKVANAMVHTWAGPPAMMNIFRKMFGSHSCPAIIRQNNFSNFQNYFILKAIPKTMATLRNAHGYCPPDVLQFLLDLFKYNDNTKNKYSDNYYRASLIDALAATITPAVTTVCISSICPSTDSLTVETKLILEEVTGYLNLDKLLPSYRLTVTVSCLRAIRRLQRFGHVPSDPTIFKSYAIEGNFIDVRLVALEGLVDYVAVEKNSETLYWLLDLVERDADPYLRFSLVQLLTHNPPFTKKDISSTLSNEELVDKLWTLMNSTLAHDSRLRCAVADLYQTLFGRVRPACLPIPDSVIVLNLKDKRAMTNSTFKSDILDMDSSSARPDTFFDLEQHASISNFDIKYGSGLNHSPPYCGDLTSPLPSSFLNHSSLGGGQGGGGSHFVDEYQKYVGGGGGVGVERSSPPGFVSVPRAEFEVTIRDEENSLKLSEDDSSSSSESFVKQYQQKPGSSEVFGAPSKILSKFSLTGSAAPSLPQSSFFSSLSTGAGDTSHFSLSNTTNTGSLFEQPGGAPSSSLFSVGGDVMFVSSDNNVVVETVQSGPFSSPQSTTYDDRHKPPAKKRKVGEVGSLSGLGVVGEVSGDVAYMSSSSESMSPPTFRERERSTSPDYDDV